MTRVLLADPNETCPIYLGPSDEETWICFSQEEADELEALIAKRDSDGTTEVH